VSGVPLPRGGGDDGLAFFSRITAGQSHELSNVLNIINELVGLQWDVLSGAAPDDPIDREKLREVCGRIRAQIDRGGEIVRGIHGFAHSADVPRAVFDVKETLCRVVFLAERWTRLKEVDLTAEVPRETIALENDPFLFQRAVFLGIDAALQAATASKRIRVAYSREGDGVEVVVTSADPVPRGEAIERRLDSLRRVVEDLGGELRAGPSNREGDRFVFFVANARGPESADDTTAE
jgi:signal transduction histidine kinase